MKILALTLCVISLFGCSNQRHVSATEFEAEYSMAGRPEPMRLVEYLGRQNGRAYIKVSSMSTFSEKWSDRVVYVKLAELDTAFLNSLPATELNDTH
ncbi:MAG: hypothetical protein ACKVX7_03490 [Planctomycetota bacterium]